MPRQKKSSSDAWWSFTGEAENFRADSPERISRLYFPLCNDAGLMSAITPRLQGDIKTGLHSFLTQPDTTEDLHNTRSGRNFWAAVEGREPWSAAGSPGQAQDACQVEAGMLWHRVTRENKRVGLRAAVTNFVPVNSDTLEIMVVELTNISRAPIRVTPTAAIPLFGRSADNLRDHRHVTSLLNRIELHRHGVLVQPTMSFDERGHRPNSLVYTVLGLEEDGGVPVGSFPTVASFIGEGGHFDRPQAVFEDLDIPDLNEVELQGREAIGALRFKSRKLAPGKSAGYILLMGIASDHKTAEGWLKTYSSIEKVRRSLDDNKEFWSSRLDNIHIQTDDANFNRWFRWVSVQPILRKIFGNSFLPDFDYGRGGRGWRDLWQDCLALMLMDAGSVRDQLLNNFAGVRPDGTNATIIGKNPGEFAADRNNISRVWMDHGVWPWLTTELYVHQTGDLDFLLEDAPYFTDRGGEARGSVLEHLIVQHLAAAENIGDHGHCRLLDADWNDGLDMAREHGESVAFTAMFAGNLLRLADLIDRLKKQGRVQTLAVRNTTRPAEVIAGDLRDKGNALAQNVRDQEWISAAGHSWFNGYYDNDGQRVEGEFGKTIRMTLTGQVFPILSGVANDEQIASAYAAVCRYLQDKRWGGFRLNTNFGEPAPKLGRAFGFAYGEKENGAFFSHMVVLFAFALYHRGFAAEGHEVLTSLYRMGMNQEAARIYPGLPEYFNGEGRGLYHYLTGSASWYLLAWITQVLGIRGEWGDLILNPKLAPEQFGKSGQVLGRVNFAGKRLNVTYFNRGKKPYGKCHIESVLLHGRSFSIPAGNPNWVRIPRADLQALPAEIDITVSLA